MNLETRADPYHSSDGVDVRYNIENTEDKPECGLIEALVVSQHPEGSTAFESCCE